MWLLEDGGSTGSIQFDIRPRTTCIAAGLAAAIYILSSISYTTLETPFSARGTMEIYTMRTVVYFGGVALLFAYQSQLRDLLTQREADALRNMLHIQYENYKIRQESVDLINQKYHDLKHQIAVLRAESGEERNAVLDKMEQEMLLKIITGEKPVDYFDEFVTEWNKTGGEQITEEVNQAIKQ